MMEMTTNSLNQINTTSASAGNGSVNQSFNIMSAAVLSLIFFLGVFGNGVVIWVTGFKMKKTVNTVWYLNLAVADLIFAAFLPLNVTYVILGMHWPFGKFVCRLDTTISFLNMFASVYILVVISVDRCVSVVWPVWAQNHRNVCKASCVSVAVWILALILSAPYFFFVDTWEEIGTKILCFNCYAVQPPSVSWLQKFHQATVITRFLLLFAVPFSVIVSCYAAIIHRLRRSHTLASQSSRPFKIIAVIIITFFLCWSPFHIMSLIELVKFNTASSNVIFGNRLAKSLAFLTSCLNPVIYVFVGQDFKKEIHKSILNLMKNAFQEEGTHSLPGLEATVCCDLAL